MTQNALNKTAYRVLQLLRWLSAESLTFEQINDRFAADALIGKPVSPDSLWFYLNTLKALGCIISRPSPRNRFCYHIQFHPFTYRLTDKDLEVLNHTLMVIDDANYWDVQYFNQWLHKIFDHVSNEDRTDLARQFFRDTRSVSCQLDSMVQRFEQHAKSHDLLIVTYISPQQGAEEKIFLPKRLFCHQNIIYILGHTHDREGSSMLRLDRVSQVRTLAHPELRHQLLQKQLEKPVYLIRIFNCAHNRYEALGENEETFRDPFQEEHLIVKFRCDNPFLLRQKLLSSEYYFQVIYPQQFQQDLQQTLYEMRQLYA